MQTPGNNRPVASDDLRLHLASLRQRLLTHASVEDCAALSRRTIEGNHEIAAYVVLSGPFLPDRLHAHLKTLDTPGPLPVVYIPVAALPLTPAGKADEAALLTVPVLDSRVIEKSESALCDLPGVCLAAAVIGDYAERRPALHLKDLIPGWRAGEGAASADASALAEITVPTRRETPVSNRLSLSEGIPIRFADDEPQTLPDALRRAAQEFASSGMVYVQADGSEITQTYAALKDDAERILTGLRKIGLRPGDKVLFQLDHNQDFIPAFWGCTLGGFIPVPISIAPTYDQPNANIAKLHNAYLMLDKPIILAGDDLTPRVRSLTGLLEISTDDPNEWRVFSIGALRENPQDSDWHQSSPNDLAIMLLTSGSTGKPKGVTQRHSSLLLRSAATVQDNDFDANEISLNWFPMDHVGGIVMFHLRDVYLGCRQVHAPTNYIVIEPLKWLDLIHKFRVTNTWAPNFAYGLVNARSEEVAKGSWNLSSLRFILNAGEAIVSRTARRFMEILQPHGLPRTAMRPSWGMSETCSAVTYAHDFTLETSSDDDSFVVVGTPIPDFAMRILDGNDNLVSEGTIGKLQVRGPSVTPGYYKNDEVNKESFTDDGWFNTGDLGILRDGGLTITGRQKDVIIINGVNFYSHEIEAVAEEVDGVEVSFTAACPVRLPGRDTDDIAIFFHSPHFAARSEIAPTADEERSSLLREIRGAVVRNVGVNPTFLVPVEKSDVPKTEIGKIQRAQLRQRFESGEFDLVLKNLDILTSGPNTVPDWFFRSVWREKDAFPPVLPVPPALPVQLLFATQDDLSARIAERLSAFGPVVKVVAGGEFVRLEEMTFSVRPGEGEDYARLMMALADLPPVRQVVHCWTSAGTGGEIRSVADLEAGAETGLYSLLALCQALTHVQRAEEIVRVQVVSRYTQSVLPGDQIAIERTPILGIIKTIAQELPHLDIGHVDLGGDDSENVEFVLAELQNSVRAHSEREAAYRNGRRYIARLELAALSDAPPSKPLFVPGGLALITGGLGGIGTEVAARLLNDYPARILLTGRTPLPARETWAAHLGENGPMAERISAYQRLEELATTKGGEVCYAAVDAADTEGLREAVRQACAAWNTRLTLAFHLAGSYHDCLLLDETKESFQDLLRPKISGAWAIHQVMKEYPGSAFVGFSSVVSSFGGAMIGAYVTANRFLSSFSQFQQSAGGKSYCFEWSTWDGLGMSRGYGGKDPLRARGFLDMSLKQGIDSMVAALHRPADCLLIGLDSANAFVRRHSEPHSAESLRTQQMRAYSVLTEGATDTTIPSSLELTDRYGTPVRCPIRRLTEMPLSETGEIDREALADLGRRSGGGARRVAARTETEKRMMTIWQETLGASAIGVFDNFFELGGHSLLATQVIARVRDVFGADLPLRRLFEAPTIARLSEWLDGTDANEDSAQTTPIERVSRDQALPLSFTQQRLWFIDQMEPGNPVYNITVAFRLIGDLNVPVLKRAINEIVRRHEPLRTIFPATEGIPSQHILPELTVGLSEIELSHLTGEEREIVPLRLMAEESRKPFDLTNGPLLRCVLLHQGVNQEDGERMLLLSTHHIISDGWSIAVFNRELSALYDAFLTGAPSPLPELPIQFADYTVWQRQTMQGTALERQADYWRGQLADASRTLNLPTDKPRPAIPSYRGAKIYFDLPLDLAEAARAVSQQYGATLFMTFLAAFQTTLRRRTGQDDICVGSPIAGRTHTETEPLIGFLANTLVLRAEFSGNPTFFDLLTRVRETAIGAYAHQEMPFEKLVETLRPPRDPSRNPLFQANFRLQTIKPAPLELSGVDVERIEVDSGISRFDVAMELWSYPDSFGGYFEYSDDLFEKSTARLMVSLFEETLTALVARPNEPIDALFSLAPAPKDTNGAAVSLLNKRGSLRDTRRKAVSLS